MGLAQLASGGNNLQQEYPLYEDMNIHDPVYVKYEYPLGTQVRRVQTTVSDINEPFTGRNLHSCMVDSNKVVYAYTDRFTGEGSVIAATVTGQTNMAFGAAVMPMGSMPTGYIDICAIDTDKFVVIQELSASSGEGIAFIGTVVGNTITLGSHFVFSTVNTCRDMSVCKVDIDKFVVAYQDGSDNLGYARVGDVAGLNIVYGPTWNYAVSESWENVLCGLEPIPHPNKFVIIYRRTVGTSRAMARLATVSGLNIIAPTAEVDATYSFARKIKAVYNEQEDKIILAYIDNDQGGMGVQAMGDMSTGTPVFLHRDQYIFYTLPVDAMSLTTLNGTGDGQWSMMWADTLNGSIGWYQNYYWYTGAGAGMISCVRPKHCFEYWEIVSTTLQRIGNEEFVTGFTIIDGWHWKTESVAYWGGWYLPIEEPIGFMAESGLAGETKKVDLYGTLHDWGSAVSVGIVYYIGRDGLIGSTELSKFIMGVGAYSNPGKQLILLTHDTVIR